MPIERAGDAPLVRAKLVRPGSQELKLEQAQTRLFEHIRQLATLAKNLDKAANTCAGSQTIRPNELARQMLLCFSGLLSQASEVPHQSDNDDYVDQKTAPIPKDVFLRLAREKAFPSTKVGKRILAS